MVDEDVRVGAESVAMEGAKLRGGGGGRGVSAEEMLDPEETDSV